MKLRDKILIAVAWAITMGLIVLIGSGLGEHWSPNYNIW